MPATTKGMFFNDLVELIRNELGPDEAEAVCRELDLPTRYRALESCSIVDEVRLQEAIIRRLYPAKSVEAGMYLIGHTAFSTFAESLSGKIGLTLLANNPRQLAHRVPQYMKMINSWGKVTVDDVGEKQVRLVCTEYREYGAHHQGMLQAGLDHIGVKGTVELEVQRFDRRGPGDVESDFTLNIAWG